jgi:hypothetical protein
MMKSAILATVASLLFPLNAAAIQLYTFYAECELGLIDTYTGTSTPAGSLADWSVEAMDYGPDGMLYATVEQGCGVHGSANTLAIIDPETLTVYEIGAIGWDDVDSLAFSPSGELFAVSVASYELITIDPGTGEGTLVGPLTGLPGTFPGAIEFLPDGTLMGIDMLDAAGGPSHLYMIDSGTGTVSLVGPLVSETEQFVSVEGMTVAPGPFRALIALAKSMEADEHAQLIRVDENSGLSWIIQDMPLPLPAYEGQRDALVALPAIEIEIDIKPWSWPNSINLRQQGLIAVAILTTDEFDATVLSTRRGRFGPAAATLAHGAAHIEDVDLDGDLDLLMHFQTGDTGIQCGDQSAELRTVNEVGLAVIGTDTVRTVGCK